MIDKLTFILKRSSIYNIGTMNNLRDKTFNAAGLSFLIYSLSSISISICLVNIKKDLHFSFTQAGLFSMICAIEQMIILLISPIFAGKFGKIKVLRVSLLLLTIGLVCFSYSVNFITALLSALCMGLGVANMEALLTPIVKDLYPEDTGAKMNKLHAFWPLGSFTGLIGFGYLLSMGISWRCLYLGMALAAFLIGFLYPASKRIPLPPSDGSFSTCKAIFSQSAFWCFGFALFFEGGAEGAFSFWAATLVQVHLKGSAFYAGIVTATFAFGMAIGRFAVSRVLRRVSVQKVIIISASGAFLVSLIFSFVNSLFVLALFLFCMGAFLACLWPTIQSYAAVVLPVDSTALMIFLSCFGVPGYSTSSFIMGMIGDKKDLFTAFISVVPVFLIAVPIFFVVGSKIAGRPALRQKR